MTQKDLSEIEATMRQWAEQCDNAFAAKLIDAYLADAPKCLANLRQALEQGAQAEFKRAAHTLKSSSGQLGITFYAETAKRVEMAALDGRMGELAEPVRWLEDGFGEIHAELQRLRGQLVADAPGAAQH